MEDYIILRSGYDNAINDCLDVIEKLDIDRIDKQVIKKEILRKQRAFLIGNKEYEGTLYKYYNEENKLGYIVFDDIYEIKGVCIFVEEGTYTELNKKELVFVMENNPIIFSENFKNKDLINLRYDEWLKKFKKITE